MSRSMSDVSTLEEDSSERFVRNARTSTSNGSARGAHCSRSSITITSDQYDRPAVTSQLLEDEGLKLQKTQGARPFNDLRQYGNTPYIHKSSWYYDWWFREILAILLGIGSTVAIVVILAMYDDKSLKDWPSKVTINTMLSVLSTVSKLSSNLHWFQPKSNQI